MPFDLPRVRELLPGRRIEWFDSIDSTMNAAARLAREGCAPGTVVGADEQTAGVGRHGRSWHSEAGAGLYVSVVLKPTLSAEALPLVMLALGLATHEAIAQATGLAADLRWPNDVLLGGRKCAGILAQLEGGVIIAGIGVNVSHARFPPEIEDPATSLRLEGAAVSREDLLVALVRAVNDCCRILTKEGAAAILKMFSRASSYAQGRRVRVEQEGATLEGVTCGLDSSGFLRLREENGKETTILAGGVRPV
jgi:BirA family transcriptional regulator, biotin operon repressor / biotin---[acetyl-CoA-carboxylase] ligase